MAVDQKALEHLIAKDEIRDLALLYSRGVDRKDIALLKTLYAEGATDHHGDAYDGDAEGYIAFLERSLAHLPYSGHHICNHLISVDGDTGDGEVYALAYHIYPDGKGGAIEDVMAVRYIDNYAKIDGRWMFTRRVVTFDLQSKRSIPIPESFTPSGPDDPSYQVLSQRLFARGPRP